VDVYDAFVVGISRIVSNGARGVQLLNLCIETTELVAAIDKRRLRQERDEEDERQ
jgi:hypothetical protein